MVLGIETTKREAIRLMLYYRDGEKCFEFKTEDQSTDILVAIDGILKKEKKSLQDIQAILVNRGPGSFTGTRVGVTVANALAWSLDIPVYGFSEDERGKVLAKLLQRPQSKFSKIVLPYYV